MTLTALVMPAKAGIQLGILKLRQRRILASIDRFPWTVLAWRIEPEAHICQSNEPAAGRRRSLTTGTAIQFKRTAFYALHKAAGARMVEFAGWEMPVEYSGIVAEHMAVRTAAGLFDVSHMGEVELAGKDALAAVQRISTNDAARLSVGQAQYSALTTPAGTFVDDIVVYRLASDHFLLVVNAGDIEKKYRWIAEHSARGDVAAVNSS